ncbi:glutathione S-transferase family protein [Aspergillus novofumigatus IBT 16806]|uniref:glutathione transferase n=1 Tax=Aspergillus novofumigatus (strain IBT 16806) TaxID=1392255 RepID=A0A2I1BSN3_ASPN1|nr:glutathione S-transferase Ure2-like protein [Aspergillus novofumigatus IBT 16806]PKX88344.1 glutathione S-transferase Ure2-like protein [Aspergillus novofumigatus IBT 16806]
MSQPLKPITVYGGSFGPNPFKISIILSELDLPTNPVSIEFSELKTPAYESINPNGRLPAIHDPNTGITLWESGAIIEYLIETYDKDRRISFAPGTAEAHQARQWLYFQASGQGPYYGQAVWFKRYHPERVQSALDRYLNEIRRVSQVLNRWLETSEWLVGDRLSYADLAFVSWQNAAESMLSDEGFDAALFPHVAAWLERMNTRATVKELIKKQERMMAEKLAKATEALKG